MEPMVDGYFATHSVRKIHLGAGGHLLAPKGWLDTDVHASASMACVNASHPLPFPDGSVDRVFSEHMIEHLGYEQGRALLKEIHRVLKPGGRVRTACPDLTMFIGFFQPREQWTDAMRAYAQICADWDGHRRPAQLLHRLTHMDWPSEHGHRYQYDEQELRDAYESAGLTTITRYHVGLSDDPELQGLEHIERLPPGMLDVETLVLEATRPT